MSVCVCVTLVSPVDPVLPEWKSHCVRRLPPYTESKWRRHRRRLPPRRSVSRSSHAPGPPERDRLHRPSLRWCDYGLTRPLGSAVRRVVVTGPGHFLSASSFLFYRPRSRRVSHLSLFFFLKTKTKKNFTFPFLSLNADVTASQLSHGPPASL